MPVMQQPEAYLSSVSEEEFDSEGRLGDGNLKGFLEKIAHAFHDWVEMIHRSRQLLAEDAAHASAKAKEHA
jgi:chromate reductase